MQNWCICRELANTCLTKILRAFALTESFTTSDILVGCEKGLDDDGLDDNPENICSKMKTGSLWCRMSTKLHIERLGDLGNLRQRRKDLTLHREGQYQFNKCQSFSWPIPFRFGDKRTMSFHQITIWNSMSNKDAGYKTEDEVEWSWEVFSREDNTISTNDIFCSIFLELRIQCRHMKMQTGNSRKRLVTANTFILPTYPDIH